MEFRVYRYRVTVARDDGQLSPDWKQKVCCRLVNDRDVLNRMCDLWGGQQGNWQGDHGRATRGAARP